MIKINNQSYYTPKEVATQFGVKTNTIARWRQSGKLKAHQLNKRKFLFSENSLEEFVKGEQKI